LDRAAFTITFGFSRDVNIIGVLGVILLAQLLRRH
jgi:hypothetical protein